MPGLRMRVFLIEGCIDEVACCRCGGCDGWDWQRRGAAATPAHLRADSTAARGSRAPAAGWPDGMGAGALALGWCPLCLDRWSLCAAWAALRALCRGPLGLGATRGTVDLAPSALGV